VSLSVAFSLGKFFQLRDQPFGITLTIPQYLTGLDQQKSPYFLIFHSFSTGVRAKTWHDH
jgi:hypothetical protein